KPEASNCVISAAPLRPSRRDVQLDWTSFPTAVTRPVPVMTTLRVMTLLLPYGSWASLALARSALLLADVVDGVADRLQLLRVLVGDLDAELLLERHDQLDRVEGIRTKVVD